MRSLTRPSNLNPRRRSARNSQVHVNCEMLERRALLSAAMDWVLPLFSGIDARATGVALDNAGNTYYTGFFAGTINLDFEGSSTSGEISMPGTYDFPRPYGSFVSKVDSGRNLVWGTHLLKDSNSVFSHDLAITQSGEVFVAGSIEMEPDGGEQLFISKLDKNGKVLWTARPQTSAVGGDIKSVATDADGDVIVVGRFNGNLDFDHDGKAELHSLGKEDGLIAKLDGNGKLIWARTIAQEQHSFDVASVAVDAAGNIYTTGTIWDPIDIDPGPGVFRLDGSFGKAFVQKLDSAGNFVWAKALGGPAYAYAEGTDLTVDSAGNVYSTGFFGGSADFDPGPGVFTLDNGVDPLQTSRSDIYVSKLDGNGNFVWATQAADGKDFIATTGSIALGAGGNVYVYGGFTGTVDFDLRPGACNTQILTGNADLLLLKLNSSGHFISAQKTEGIGGINFGSMAANPRGDIAITGWFTGEKDFEFGRGVTNMMASSLDGFLLRLHEETPKAPASAKPTNRQSLRSQVKHLKKRIAAAKAHRQDVHGLGAKLRRARAALKRQGGRD